MDIEGENHAAMKQALLNSKIIDNLPIEILSKIYEAFDKSSTNKHSVKWLKDRIGGICLTEGYSHFLCLEIVLANI
jgi:hypothetical protein